ncbi:hypothetical protein ACFO8Q_20160 [Effusibacillus consociatus]|uniref:Uncharacterized protein n=1 Tax=Effusibacillus consociatus TaxID=1117041 RepID=A0ABV9Q763_9BACL
MVPLSLGGISSAWLVFASTYKVHLFIATIVFTGLAHFYILSRKDARPGVKKLLWLSTLTSFALLLYSILNGIF